MEAQRYPGDYSGIYAASPAINWDRFHVAMMWPYIVQNTEGEFVSQCVFDSLTAAATTMCGGPDGLIQEPNKCQFNASTQVGAAAAACAGSAPKSRRGRRPSSARSWWAPSTRTARGSGPASCPGRSYSGLAGAQPFPLSSSWIKNFVLKKPNMDLRELTYAAFPAVFAQSRAAFNDIIGTDNPDLSAFKAAGRQAAHWHGLADQLIFANGTLDYRLRVEAAMGGSKAVDDFYRLFMVPRYSTALAGPVLRRQILSRPCRPGLRTASLPTR